MVNRFDGYRLDLSGRAGLQRLDDVAVGLDRVLEIGIQLADRSVVELFQVGVDVVDVHVDQETGPLRGGSDDPALIVAIVGGVAVRGPDHGDEDNRADRDPADQGRRDAVAREDTRPLVWHAGEGTGLRIGRRPQW